MKNTACLFLIIAFLLSCNQNCWECHTVTSITRSDTTGMVSSQIIDYPCHMTQDEIEVYQKQHSSTVTQVLPGSNVTVTTKRYCGCIKQQH